MDRCPHGRHQVVDAGDPLVGVDEQPLPVHRHHLHVQRPGGLGRGQGFGGVQLVRTDPDHPAQEHDHQDRDRPDQQLQPPRIAPFGQVACARVGGAEPPGEGEGGDHRRDHDGQHDHQGVQGDQGIGAADRPLGVEHVVAAARQHHCAGKQAAYAQGASDTRSDRYASSIAPDGHRLPPTLRLVARVTGRREGKFPPGAQCKLLFRQSTG